MASSARAAVNFRKLAIIILVGVIVYNEYFVYFSAFWSWPSKRSGQKTILLVADPQLQGVQNEPGFPIGAITR